MIVIAAVMAFQAARRGVVPRGTSCRAEPRSAAPCNSNAKLSNVSFGKRGRGLLTPAAENSRRARLTDSPPPLHSSCRMRLLPELARG